MISRVKIKTYLSVLGLLALLANTDVHASTIRISSPRVELELAPGETYTGEITAENPDNEEINVRVYAEDWIYADGGTGEKKFSPAGTQPLSASNWINFNNQANTIKPYGRMTAHYTVTVPQDATGTHYAVLFFETQLGVSKNEEGANVQVAGRIGALFFVQVKGTVTRSGEIKGVKIAAPQGNQPMEIETIFQNTGNVDIALGGNFLIMNDEGKVLGRGDLNTIYTFPGVSETRKTQWVGKLPKGTHQMVLTYDMGLGKSIVKEEVLTIS